MSCDEADRVQLYFDAALDATASAAVERHLASCQECAALFNSLESMRAALRRTELYHRAPAGLRLRIAQTLGRETGKGWSGIQLPARNTQFWRGAITGAIATGIAAAFAFFVLSPPASNPLIGDVVGAHLRSLVGNHLIDVASSDQHTVKPWFAGHADVSPPAEDFPKQDYRLIGGRADYVDGHRAAVVVYRHEMHMINVFSWPHSGESLPGTVTRKGYHAVFWRSGDIDYCAVSDTALNELQDFVHLFEATGAPDSRE